MANYVKLFGSILDSTVWKLPPAIKVVWVTLMAMADRDGIVEASLPGLADRAKVPLRTAEKAVGIFLAPDPHSKTPTNEGRRIEVISGGWRLINFEAYREKQSLDDRKTKNAARQQRFRERQAAKNTQQSDTVTPDVTLSNAPLRSVTPSDASCSALASDLSSPPEPPDQTRPPARSEPRATWTGLDWLTKFRAAWMQRRGGIWYGMAGDTKATATLDDVLEPMPTDARLAAQAGADRMFAEYFSRTSARHIESKYCFAFFVGDFGALRILDDQKPAGFVPRPFPSAAKAAT